MQSATLEELLRERGQKARIAKVFGVDKSTLTRWVKNGVPAEKVLKFEQVTGIDKTKIRPDLYHPASSEPESERAAS